MGRVRQVFEFPGRAEGPDICRHRMRRSMEEAPRRVVNAWLFLRIGGPHDPEEDNKVQIIFTLFICANSSLSRPIAIQTEYGMNKRIIAKNWFLNLF